MIRRPPRSTLSSSSAASDVYKRQGLGHVDIRQLYPGSPRPLRWNILQVPRRIDPGRYRSMVAELFANAGRLGARQLGFMRRALTELYFEAGVLTGDPKLQDGPLGRIP